MTRGTVIITDGDQRAALAIVRSLAGAGYRCLVTSGSGRSMAGASRHAARDVVVPDALRDPLAFVDAHVALAADEAASVLIPVSEAALLALLPARARFTGVTIPFPDEAEFLALTDKQRVLREASAVGIHTPEQVVIGSASTPLPLAARTLRYPVALKPARSIGIAHGARAKVGVTYAYSQSTLAAAVRALSPAAFPLLVQERIVGEGIGIFILMWNEACIASFAHRRIAEKPPAGGVSVICESVRMDADLLARSRALLERLAWRGVAMVEFKRDTATGRAYLMEINGRFWGSLQLALDAGADFPLWLVAASRGEPVEWDHGYTIGMRSRWWWGEIDHLIARVRRRGVNTTLPAGTIAAWRVALDAAFGWLRPRAMDGVFRWRDAGPFLRESVDWFRRQ